jgi:hypothetical protein
VRTGRRAGGSCWGARGRAAAQAKPPSWLSDRTPTPAPPPAPGAAPNERTATATLASVRPRPAGVPTGALFRACDGACGPAHDGSRPLAVSLFAPEAPADAVISWTANGAPVAGAAGRLLTLQPADLPAAGGPLRIAATITTPASGLAGSASLVVPVNAPPACAEAAGCLSLSSATAPFAGPGVTAAAAGYTDDGDLSDLTYEWGVVAADGSLKPLLIDRAPSFKFSALPQGLAWVYVRVTDSLGASAFAKASVNVTAPAAGFKAAAAATAVDAAGAAATKDPSAIGRASRQLLAIRTYSAGVNTSAADKAAIEAAVNSKGEALLKATSETVNEWDPEGAQTAVGTAADIIGAMTNRTAEARAASVGTADTSARRRGRGEDWGAPWEAGGARRAPEGGPGPGLLLPWAGSSP